MPRPNIYPITAAELARRLEVDGKRLRDVLRAYPELTPGHLPNEHYRIDQHAEQAIRGHPAVSTIPGLHRR